MICIAIVEDEPAASKTLKSMIKKFGTENAPSADFDVAEFSDAAVKTGNNVLDVILTEKSLLFERTISPLRVWCAAKIWRLWTKWTFIRFSVTLFRMLLKRFALLKTATGGAFR